MYEHIYWKQGATELATGKKTLTLKQFEKKYSSQFIQHAKEYKAKNMWAKYKTLSEADQRNPDLINALRQLDVNVNVNLASRLEAARKRVKIIEGTVDG
jgi:tryptophan 2,3-dioxygenase